MDANYYKKKFGKNTGIVTSTEAEVSNSKAKITRQENGRYTIASDDGNLLMKDVRLKSMNKKYYTFWTTIGDNLITFKIKTDDVNYNL